MLRHVVLFTWTENTDQELADKIRTDVKLPTYPWQRERHWDESETSRLYRFGDVVRRVVRVHRAPRSGVDRAGARSVSDPAGPSLRTIGSGCGSWRTGVGRINFRSPSPEPYGSVGG